MWNTRATREKAGGSVFIKKKKKKILLQGQHVRVLHKLFIWLCAANYIMLIFYVHFTLPYLIFSTSPFSLSCSGHPNTTSRWKKKKDWCRRKERYIANLKISKYLCDKFVFSMLIRVFYCIITTSHLPFECFMVTFAHPSLYTSSPPPPLEIWDINRSPLLYYWWPQHLPTLHAPPLSILFHRYFFYWYNVLSRLVHSE